MNKNLLSILLFSIFSITSFGQQTDAYGGFLDINGEKTGFFHTEQINDRWSLVTPDGHAFYGIGMAHPVTGFTQSAVHFVLADDQEAWFKGSIQRMRDLGFNCVWSGPYCPERLQSDFVDKALDHKYHETLSRLQQVMRDRKALLTKYPAIERVKLYRNL